MTSPKTSLRGLGAQRRQRTKSSDIYVTNLRYRTLAHRTVAATLFSSVDTSTRRAKRPGPPLPGRAVQRAAEILRGLPVTSGSDARSHSDTEETPKTLHEVAEVSCRYCGRIRHFQERLRGQLGHDLERQADSLRLLQAHPEPIRARRRNATSRASRRSLRPRVKPAARGPWCRARRRLRHPSTATRASGSNVVPRASTSRPGVRLLTSPRSTMRDRPPRASDAALALGQIQVAADDVEGEVRGVPQDFSSKPGVDLIIAARVRRQTQQRRVPKDDIRPGVARVTRQLTIARDLVVGENRCVQDQPGRGGCSPRSGGSGLEGRLRGASRRFRSRGPAFPIL